MRPYQLVALLLLGGAFAAAQETRGEIAGVVTDPQGARVATAVVTVTDLDTKATNQIKTNSTGYFLAPLLLPGNYEVVVEAPGFKRSVRRGLILSVGQHIELDLTIEVGSVSDSVAVFAEAPLLDTSSATAGQNLDRRSVEALPAFNNMSVLLTRFVAGVNASADVQYVAQGYVNRTSSDYSALGAVGGSEWTIDGATNNGSDRRLATSPNSEMIQEMRVETGNFDASSGHGTGIGISMMTRNGANDPHGSASWEYWNNRWNSPNLFQRQVYYRNIANARASGNIASANQLASAPILPAGFGKSFTLTLGGPVYIPKVINGKNKLFFFLNYSWDHDLRIGANASGVDTVPTLANRKGDFSQLLNVGAQYQVYDPLSVRTDAARATHYIRTAFPGNIIPSSRISNPMYSFYVNKYPNPCCDPVDPKLEPLNNQRTAGDPDPIHNRILGSRTDYNLSEKNRFFFRWSYSRFTEGLADWTWQVQPGFSSDDTLRKPLSGTADWTYAKSAKTIVNVQLSANQYMEFTERKGAAQYKPSDVGLPAYLDQKCLLTACTLPVVTLAGYHTMGKGAPTGYRTRNIQTNLNVTRVLSQHTLRFGTDIREAFRTSTNPGNSGGSFSFTNAYTRKNDDTAVAPAGDLGLSWAAFMLGVPTSMAVDANDSFATQNPYYSGFVQDAWRVTRALTVNVGLRFEFEQGITERYDRMLVGWDPNLKLKITDAATAAYAAKPLAELAPSSFLVQGGSLYATADRHAWKSQAMLLPRFALAWQVNRRTVVRGGYGVYYDTLNATATNPNQLGYSTTTTNVASNDFGVTWNSGNPGAGISPAADPFPVRADGSRFETPYRNALGAMMVAGTAYTYGNLQQEHARLQRWRVGVQRELGSNMVLEAAYTGQYSGNAGLSVRQDVLPETYWNGTLARNSALATDLNSNVSNPFYINNFQSLKTSDPLLYSRLASVSFFTSATVAKNRLLRPFPEMSTVTASNLPMRKVRVHSLDVTFQRRFANGLSLNMAFSSNRAEEWSTVLNEYDLAPTQWLTSGNAQPYRVTGSGVYQLPFGKGRAFLKQGILSAIAGGWQTAATFEWQPGPLLSWGNLFFYGKLGDIASGDKTLDRWFNTGAGFEKDPAKVPAAFQKRVFPTVIDGLRRDKTMLLNANVQREIRLKERVRVQLRLDAANVLNRTHFQAPNLDPTSTQFGMITNASTTATRFLMVIGRVQF
jgi:hypothetical protein